MLVLCRSSALLISLLLAASPAYALDIAPALDGSTWDAWSNIEPVIVEFDDDDWADFVGASAADLPSALGADTGSLESLLTQVSQRR